jgi:hypothetical protein
MIPLTSICWHLRQIAATPDDVPSYQTVHRACLDGRFPTTLRGQKRFCEERDVPVVAKALGVALRPGRAAA